MHNINTMRIEAAPIPRRAINALSATGRYKTLADIDRAPDHELLAASHLGWKSLTQTRKVIETLKNVDVLEWAQNHENLIRAILAGEAEIVFK